MRIFSFLLLLIPSLVWANVQDAFDNGRFEQVIEVLGEQYRDGHLSVDEQLLLAKAYKNLGRLRNFGKQQQTLDILNSLKSKLTNSKRKIEVYALLVDVYLSLDDLEACSNSNQALLSYQLRKENQKQAKYFVELIEPV